MDHYNATVHNGALVSTRRGLHVSKTKHHGTRFVNTFAAPTTTTSSSSRPSSGQQSDGFSQFRSAKQPQTQQPPQEHRFKFVAKPTEKVRGAPRGRPRKLPIKDSTPGSSEDSGEEATFSGELSVTPDEFFGAFSPGSTYIPKQWKTYRFGHDMPELTQKLIHVYLEHTPRHLYPFEQILTYNPVRDPTFFNRINCDMVTMQSIIMTASLMDSVQKGDSSFEELQYYITRVCGMVNERLVDQTNAGEPAVLESIAAMAIAGLFMGRNDLWHVHMKGLRYVIARNGGMTADWGHVLNKIRKADIKGAAYTGGTPYLEFTRYFASVSDILAPEVRAGYSLTIQRILQRVGIAQINIDSIRALVLVSRAINLALHAPPGSILFDPQSYSEEIMHVEYQLVKYPGPLRDETQESSYANGYSSSGENDTSGYGHEQFDNRSSSSDTTLPFTSQSVIPTETANILDPVVRIAGILYFEELIPEPRTIDPYAVPLGLLSTLVRDIVMRLHDREAAFLAPGPEHPFLDGLPQDPAALRPVLLWACMVAYTVAHIAEADTTFRPSHAVDRVPYQDCVALLLGAASPCAVDALPEGDFELARLLPVQELHSSAYDDRSILKTIVADYEARQMVAIAPFM